MCASARLAVRPAVEYAGVGEEEVVAVEVEGVQEAWDQQATDLSG